MKKITKFMSSLALIGSTLSMVGCAHTVDAVAYGVDKVASNCGIMIYKADVSVNNGKITAASLEETYSPNVWARLTEEQSKTIDSVSTYDKDNNKIYFAKYIYVNGMNWVASVKGNVVEDYTSRYNEYVAYAAVGAASDSAAADLIRYLSVSDSSQYKLGAYANTYFNDVMNGNIKILDNTSESEKEEEAVLVESNIAPTFPDGKKKKSENANFAGWTSSTQALCSFLVGRPLNFKDRVSDSDLDNHDTLQVNDDGVWQYNQTLANVKAEDDRAIQNALANNWETITGCKAADVNQISLETYLSGMNQAFASVEYESIV